MTKDARRTVTSRLEAAGISTDDRFVRCDAGTKRATDHDDRGPAPSHQNYGVYATATDRLVLLDVDDYDDSDSAGLQALTGLPRTFEVATPHGGTHRYYAVAISDDGRLPAAVLADEFGAQNPQPSWGEVRAANQYVVGPGSQLTGCDKDWCDDCATDDGGRYRIHADREVAALTPEQLVEALRTDDRLNPDSRPADGAEEPDPGGATPGVTAGVGGSSSAAAGLSDDELLEHIRDSKQADKFARLWRGDTSGYPSHSEADQALANILTWWTDHEPHRIDRLFRRSGLYDGRSDRDGAKWDRDDYRENTISEALNFVTGRFDPTAAADGGTAATVPAPEELIAEIEAGERSYGDDASAQDAPGGSWLSPESLVTLANLEPDEDETLADAIGELSDREAAAWVWDLVKRADDVHVRVRRENDELWSFDPETGIWGPAGERALRHAARQTLTSVNYGQNLLTELKTQARGDPEAEISAEAFGVETGEIAVANGLLDLDAAADGAGDGALRPLRPEDYALARLPVPYDSDAESDRWTAFVEEVAEDSEAAAALQEYVGYCLHVGEMPIHRALLLVGTGANGKSTFLSVVQALLGEDNTSSLELQTLANERDAVADFYGSLANVDDDLSARKLGNGIGMFKKLTAGDRVRARHLYESGFEFQATGKHLYAANEVPDVSGDVADDDDAFWRRWLLIEFPQYFPPSERDPTLRRDLTADDHLPAVLNWAIRGRARLLEQGHFTGEERYPQDKRHKWQAWGDSVDQFISECVEHDPEADRLTTGEAHQRYAAWCRAQDLQPVGQQQLTIRLKEAGVGYSSSLRVDGHSSPQRGYKSLGLSDDVPDLDETPDRDHGQARFDA